MVINVHVVGSGRDGALNNRNGIWRPYFLSTELELRNDERTTGEHVRHARSLLNKLSPLNFCRIIEKLKALPVDSPGKLDKFVSLVLEKAVNEPKFSRWYLEMLCSLSDVFVLDLVTEPNPLCTSLFAEKLCTLFETLRTTESDGQKQAEIDICADPVRKLDLEAQRFESEVRMKSIFQVVGSIIGEAFMLQILTAKTVKYYIEALLTMNGENSLYCFIKLLTVTGNLLELHLDPDEMERYLDIIKKKSENPALSTKVRFALLEVWECRIISWISRRTWKNLLVIKSIYVINPEEAVRINNIFNEFTRCRRNLAEVIACFQEIAPEDRPRMILVFITCVVKCYIYSGDCGKLFAVLLYSRTIEVQNIVDGINAVIKGYYKNLIPADPQIWTHIGEILAVLFMEDVIQLDDLEQNITIAGAIKIKKNLKKKSGPKQISRTENAEPPLFQRRGVPVPDRRPNKKSEIKVEFDQLCDKVKG